MDLTTLYDMAPWEWPEDANQLIYGVLTDCGATPDDRIMAAELAGEQVVMDDRMARALMSIVENKQEQEELRQMATVSLGPALDFAFTMEFDDPDEIIITEKAFHELQQSLKKLYHQPDLSDNLRRRVMETMVRAPEEWQQEVVQAAYLSDDEEWRRTAVFSMEFVAGFDQQIMESLDNPDPLIHFYAVTAAGNWQIDAAWDHVAALVSDKDIERELLLAAIEAVIFIRPREAAQLLEGFLESDDEEIIDTIAESMAMISEVVPDDYLDEDED